MEWTKLETAAANYTYLRGLFFIPLGVLPILSWGIVLAVGAIPLWDGADPSNIGLAIVGVALMLNGVFRPPAFRPYLRCSDEPRRQG